MFLFGWGLEILGWSFGYMLLGIINSLFSFKKLVLIGIWCLCFRLNLEFEWFTHSKDFLKGTIFLFSLPIFFIIVGYGTTIKKED